MQKRSKKTRKQLIEAAMENFSRHGYDNTSVAQICRAAEVSKGAFYHHFETKQALFQSAMDEWLGDLDTQLTAARASHLPVPVMLANMSAMMDQVYTTALGHLPMYLEFWTQTYHDPELWQASITPHQRYWEFFAGLVEDGIEEGSFEDVDPQVAARVIVALAVGLLLGGLIDPEGGDWADITQQGVQMLMHGLSRRNN